MLQRIGRGFKVDIKKDLRSASVIIVNSSHTESAESNQEKNTN